MLLQNSMVFAGTTGSEDMSKSNAQNQSTASECFEGFSRVMFKFNYALDGAIFEPVAKGYRALPVPIRKGTGNALDNLRSLLTVSNNILQGDFRAAGTTAGRFVINTTVGVLGIFDTLKTGTNLLLSLTISLVAGLRAFLAFRCFTRKLPKPRSSIFSPR